MTYTCTYIHVTVLFYTCINFLFLPYFRSRGLGTLIKARNIKTIGDLSALTEKQVDELPIRSPKVSVVRKALKKFEEQTTPKSDRKLVSEVRTGKL